MKKIIISLLLLVSFVSVLFMPPISQSSLITQAVGEAENNIAKIVERFCFDGDTQINVNRYAGTEGERETAEFLAEMIVDIAPSFKLGGAGENGIAEFFAHYYDGEGYGSQNVIAVKKGLGDKKVVLGVAYDNFFGVYDGAEKVENCAFQYNILSIVSVLSLVERLDDVVLDVTIEVVFFGAENYAGEGSSSYLLGVPDEEAKNIVAFINVDSLFCGNDVCLSGLGNNKNLDKLLSLVNEPAVKKYNSIYNNSAKLIDSAYLSVDESYATKAFAERGVVSFNMLAYDAKTIAKGEYKLINDTIENAQESFGEDYLLNASVCSDFLYSTLTNPEFTDVASSFVGEGWVGKNLVLISICVAVIVLAVLFFLSRQFYDRLRQDVAWQINEVQNKIKNLPPNVMEGEDESEDKTKSNGKEDN